MERLTLRAPEDGKIQQVIAKAGEMINPGMLVVLLGSKRCYYDIYVSEKQAVHLSEGERLAGESVVGAKQVFGAFLIYIALCYGILTVLLHKERGKLRMEAQEKEEFPPSLAK